MIRNLDLVFIVYMFFSFLDVIPTEVGISFVPEQVNQVHRSSGYPSESTEALLRHFINSQNDFTIRDDPFTHQSVATIVVSEIPIFMGMTLGVLV